MIHARNLVAPELSSFSVLNIVFVRARAHTHTRQYCQMNQKRWRRRHFCVLQRKQKCKCDKLVYMKPIYHMQPTHSVCEHILFFSRKFITTSLRVVQFAQRAAQHTHADTLSLSILLADHSDALNFFLSHRCLYGRQPYFAPRSTAANAANSFRSSISANCRRHTTHRLQQMEKSQKKQRSLHVFVRKGMETPSRSVVLMPPREKESISPSYREAKQTSESKREEKKQNGNK